MPFENEFATGESLLTLHHSKAFTEFQGKIRPRSAVKVSPPTQLNPTRNNWEPNRVIAIDGSTVSVVLDNGFPMAEATLMKVSVVSIDLSELSNIRQNEIPSPRIFYDMEKAATFDCVLPGANVVRPDLQDDSPKRFFRQCAYDAFGGRLDQSHETLMETVRGIVGGAHASPRPPHCPVDDCDGDLVAGIDTYVCPCKRAETLFETDGFRFAERFSEVSSNGEAHGEVRHVVEIVALFNMLRFFARDEQGLTYLRDNVFILDGPMALFGHPAWLTPYLRIELRRINDICLANGFELAVFGFEKTGAFVDHFEQLDVDTDRGPRHRYAPRTVLALDSAYINRNITLRPVNAKPHGQDTYFGRKIFYKTTAGDHAVITTAMTNDSSRDFSRCDPSCYPRLGDILNVLDDLATYLYRDGFMPLIRANAHAAIPLKRGSDLIRGLFGKGGKQ
jgi:hypothetical protein